MWFTNPSMRTNRRPGHISAATNSAYRPGRSESIWPSSEPPSLRLSHSGESTRRQDPEYEPCAAEASAVSELGRGAQAFEPGGP